MQVGRSDCEGLRVKGRKVRTESEVSKAEAEERQSRCGVPSVCQTLEVKEGKSKCISKCEDASREAEGQSVKAQV